MIQPTIQLISNDPVHEPKPLVRNPDGIRLALAGMVEGNGHPYSWSAIFNGFRPEAMARCPYPAILEYLGEQPREAFGIHAARVTHIWCEDAAEARRVAQASLIPHVVTHAMDVIGEVDAVIIPTDKGDEHLARARPFVEAGLPVFIDKPLTDNEDDLRQFVRWRCAGKALLSTSCMRYSREYSECRARLPGIGQLRLITMTTPKSWERYGIHAIEGVYPFLTPGGWLDVANTGTQTQNIVHARHQSGVDVVLAAVSDLHAAFGCLNLYGSSGTQSVQFRDTFHAFKAQLEQFIQYLRTGELPFPFSETVEMMKILIAGMRSRNQSGRRVPLYEIKAD